MTSAQNYEFIDKKKTNGEKLSTKIYEERESLLTELLKDSNISVVRNIAYAVFLMVVISMLTHDIIYKQEINVGTTLIIKGFANIQAFWIIWTRLFITSLLPFWGVKYWAMANKQIKSGKTRRLWNLFCLTTYVMYIFCLICYYTNAATASDLGYALRAAILIENLRCVMKTYAFVRSNVKKFFKCNEEKENLKLCLRFTHYLYFLFAPVMVYREYYPRSKGRIKWGLVAYYLLNMVMCIFLYSFLLETLIQDLKNYGLVPFSWKDLIYLVIKNAPRGLLVMFLLFYMVLHTWFNAFAEILQFSDRLFYKDWWCCADDQDKFFRLWNTVVYDWLHTYIYKDFYETFIPNKYFAKLAVFIAAGIGHDYVLSFTFDFWMPIFLIQYCFSIFAKNMKVRNIIVGNVLFMIQIGVHVSIFATLYALEHFAKQNCPMKGNKLGSLFNLRFLNCNT